MGEVLRRGNFVSRVLLSGVVGHKNTDAAQQRETDAVLESGWSGMCWTRREENGGKADKVTCGTAPKAHHKPAQCVFGGALVRVREGKFGQWRLGKRAGALELDRHHPPTATAQHRQKYGYGYVSAARWRESRDQIRLAKS